MQSVAVLVSAMLVVAAAERAFDYHSAVGIPRAARLRQLELGRDFPGRFVGAEPAAPAAAPYTGGLEIMLTSGDTSMCNCVLLTNTRSLTTAQCWRSMIFQVEQFIVVLGSEYLFRGGVRVVTRDVVRHEFAPLFDTLVHDIAVINHAWVGFNSRIRPVALPTGAQLQMDFAGVWGNATGFGMVAETETIDADDARMRLVELQVTPPAQCSAATGVDSGVLCTIKDETRGQCTADNGSPLVATVDGEPVLIGIALVRNVCSQQGNADFWTQITSYSTWITEKL